MKSFDSQWARERWEELRRNPYGAETLAREAYYRGRADAQELDTSGIASTPPQDDYEALFRQYAGLAMQGLLAQERVCTQMTVASIAVQMARALVEAVRTEERQAKRDRKSVV